MRLSIQGLVQRFPVAATAGRPAGVATVLDGLDLETGDIGALVLVGPSGGGKSTLLRILAGLDVPVAGRVAFDGLPLPTAEANLVRYRRTVGTVFQAYNLFPHLTAMDNLLLPLVHVHGLSPAAARERVREPLERFGLTAHVHKRPAELSGGQKQRIAILRAVFARGGADFIAVVADGRVLAHAAVGTFFADQRQPRVRAFLERTLPT
jgi:polar amino acid transport system ATP-binding protein